MTQTLDLLNQKITTLEENSKPKRKYSYWSTKMFPKYTKLMGYLEYKTHGELYRYLFNEFNDTYPDYNLSQVVDDYCYENKIDNCYTLEAIEHDKVVRKLFEGIVDNILDECKESNISK